MNEELFKNLVSRLAGYLEASESINEESLVEYVGYYLMSKLNLQDYANSINVMDCYESNKAVKGCFNSQYKTVSIYKQGIEMDARSILNSSEYLSEYEQNLYRYLMYIKTVVHEFYHVWQEKIVAENINPQSIETSILKSIKPVDDRFVYNGMYEFHPSERVAELMANYCVTEIVKSMKNVEKLNARMMKNFLIEQVNNYLKSSSKNPTFTYLSMTSNNEHLQMLKKKIENSDLDMSQRVLYGLDITEEEYNFLIEQYKEINAEIENYKNEGKTI